MDYLRQPYPVVRDDLGLVKLAAFGCELLLIGGKGQHRVRSGAEEEVKKELEALRSLEERLTEARSRTQPGSYFLKKIRELIVLVYRTY